MCDSEEENKLKVLKEFDCYISAEFAKRLFALQYKTRPTSRHLECEGVDSSRIKATKDHIELCVPDERITKLNGDVGCVQTLQSTPRQLAADFSVNSNCAGQLNRAKVVSVSLNNGEKKEGPTRLESRRKTIHNDDDLRYLRELYLDPWREGSFNTYEPTCSFERRSILMCPDVPEEDYDRGKIDRDAWLLKYLGSDFRFDKGDLENVTLSLLRQTRTVKFDKLFERLPLKLPKGYEITQSDLLALLNKFAILIHGWWCIKSEFLYPPKSISPFEGHPREVMIKARDYVIHFSEATEILKWLGIRLSPQNGGLSRYWVFREPDRTFIQRYPSVVYQQADWWNIRICQLCQEFKMEELTWDSNTPTETPSTTMKKSTQEMVCGYVRADPTEVLTIMHAHEVSSKERGFYRTWEHTDKSLRRSVPIGAYPVMWMAKYTVIDQGKETDEAESNTVQPVSPSTLCNFSSLNENKSQSKHSRLEEPVSSSSNLPTDIISITNGDVHDFERIHSGNTASQVNMIGISNEIEQEGDANPASASVERIQTTQTHKGEAEMLLNCSQISASSCEGRLMLPPMQNGIKAVPPSSGSSEKVRPLPEKQIEEGWSEPPDTENPPSKQNGRSENVQNSNLIYLNKNSSVFEEQVLEPPCPTRCDPDISANDSILPPLAKRAKVEKEVLNENPNEKDETSVSISFLQSSSSKSVLHNQESRPRISDGCTSVSPDMGTENNLMTSCKETAKQTKEPQGSLNGYADSLINSSNPPSKGKQCNGRSISTSQTKRVGFGNGPIEHDVPIDIDKSSAVTETLFLPHRPIESSSSSSNLAPPVKGDRFKNDQTPQVGQDGMHADQTSTQSEDDKPLSDLVHRRKTDSAVIDSTISEEPTVKRVLKTEPPSLSKESCSSEQSKTACSVVDDPRVVALVKTTATIDYPNRAYRIKTETMGIKYKAAEGKKQTKNLVKIALRFGRDRELKKLKVEEEKAEKMGGANGKRQNRRLRKITCVAGDNRPPAGSEAERQMLSSDVHKILLAQGAQELNIQWPETSHCSVAAPKQPLFVPPPTLEYTNPQDPCIRVRNIILKLLEEKPCVQFGEVKKIAINDGIKLQDGKLRDVIKPPRKTTGSGFSMFASVSDPSLKGEKFGITFVSNNIDRLPPIQSPGDVVIIHRLSVSTFRGKLQGCANEYFGSAAVVFPGDAANPISPYDSICKCSFSNEDLARVADLRDWYNSPECPIEKEILPIPHEPSPTTDICNLTRLHDVKPNSFFNTDAEVVGIYTYPEDQTIDLILCLWDGEPSTDCQNLQPFYSHLDLERPPAVERMTVDPHLVCITGHTLHPLESDWSVCVFVFDEHAVAARNLKPGDMVRLYNVHCVLKYNGTGVLCPYNLDRLDETKGLFIAAQRQSRYYYLLFNDI
ncbi:hypothetical protein ACTXT7_000772 [Hymenolepis weldensis]